MARKKFLVVDTNVISHALSPQQTHCYSELFAKLEGEYTFVVTGYTKYELLCNSSPENVIKIYEYIENNMAYVELSGVLMDFSAKVRYLYSKELPDRVKGISTCDTVNAAFSIAKECDLLTIDNTDYPRAFFKDKDRFRIDYTSRSNRQTTDTVYLLTPDCENASLLAKKYGLKV